MARTKKELQVKEPVTIRFRETKHGKSILLDCYVKGKRWTEFLSKDIGYILPPVDNNARAQNTEVLQRANAIKNARINEIYAGKDKAQAIAKNSKMLLLDWIDIYAQKQLENGHKDSRQISYTKQILQAYAGANTRMQDIDKNFCIGYLNFIKHLQPNRQHETMQSVSTKCARNEGIKCTYTEEEVKQYILKRINEISIKIEDIEKERIILLNKKETEHQWQKTQQKLLSLDKEKLEKGEELNKLKNTLAKEIGTHKKHTIAIIEDKKNATIAPATQANYYRCFSGALNAAVRAEIIAANPFDKIASVDKIKVPESTREYLTIDELKVLNATDCNNERVKQAFLFSCCCGLRISDITLITWGQFTQDGEQARLQLKMKKTGDPLYLPISAQALKYMPNRGDAKSEDKIFNIPFGQQCNIIIGQWVKKAGITKKVTFHVARHTFATMMLTLGADLYTTSKLLGHADIETTQIYAKIVNAKKDEAVNLANDIF